MPKVVADTSFLIYIASEPGPVYAMLSEKLGRIDLIVPKQVIEELLQLARRGGKKGRMAGLALRLKERIHIMEVGRGLSTDDAVLRCATLNGLPVATLDKELAGRLKAAGIRVIGVKGYSLLF